MDSLDLLACAQRKTQSMYQAYEVRELIKIFDLNGCVQISSGLFNASGATVVDTSVSTVYTHHL